MIITIARQCGCGALHVGELLASQFNLVLYTRQMLFNLAKQKGILDEMRYFFEERPVDDFIMALSDNAEASDDVKQRFNKAFNRLIGDQDCIIIGRCGNSIFADRSDLVSVFLKGDKTKRIANTAEEEHVNLFNAEQVVNDTDDCRACYHKYYTGFTWGDANDYDLCIDSCRLGWEHTSQLIAQYIEHTGKNAQ